MSLDLFLPLGLAALGLVVVGVSRVLPAISPGRAPTEKLRRIDVRILLFWEGVGMLVAGIATSIIGFEADIVRGSTVIGVILGASGVLGLIRALTAKEK